MPQTNQTRPHWSYSSLSEYLMCPLKFRFHRIEGREPESVSVNLVLGKALHAVYAQVMSLIYPRVTEPVNIAEMEDFFVQQFRSLQEEKINYNGSSDEEVAQKGRAYTRTLVEYLTKNKSFNGEELWIERKFTVPLMTENQIFDLPLEGIFDLVVIDREKKLASIIDFKTSKSRYPEWRLYRNLQMLAYTYGIRQLLGEKYRATFRWEVLLKQKKPGVVEYDYLYDEDELRYFLKVVQIVERGVAGEVFYPNPSHLCSYCEYFKACRKWPGNGIGN